MLTQELKDILYNSGAALVGIADMRNISGSPLPYGICVALPIPIHIIREIEKGPTLAYWQTYQTLNSQLDKIINRGAAHLQSHKYQSIPVTTGYAKQNDEMRTPLPYKTVATRAGMGWIGKSNLLVTPEHGSALRIATLLTDAPLEYGTPIEASKCGTCRQCQIHCPAQAIRGTLWKTGIDREELIDTQTCVNIIRKRMKEHTGIEGTLCGKCFVVCPYTKQYIKRNK